MTATLSDVMWTLSVRTKKAELCVNVWEVSLEMGSCVWVSVCTSVCVCTTCQMILILYRLKQLGCDVCVKLNWSVWLLMCVWACIRLLLGVLMSLYANLGLFTWAHTVLTICVCVFAQTLMNAKQAWQIVVYLRPSVWTQQVDISANAKLDSVEMVTIVWVWQNTYLYMHHVYAYFPSLYVCVHMCISTDIDECRLVMHSCDENAECLNAVGKYQCRCRPGFTGTGFSCHGTVRFTCLLFQLSIFSKSCILQLSMCLLCVMWVMHWHVWCNIIVT